MESHLSHGSRIVEKLESELKQAKQAIAGRDAEIEKLTKQSAFFKKAGINLVEEKKDLQAQVNKLEDAISSYPTVLTEQQEEIAELKQGQIGLLQYQQKLLTDLDTRDKLLSEKEREIEKFKKLYDNSYDLAEHRRKQIDKMIVEESDTPLKFAEWIGEVRLEDAEKWWNKLHPSDNIRLCEKYKWRNIFISNEKLIEIYKAEHFA